MDVGYLNLPVMIAIWVLLALSFVMILYSAYEGKEIPFFRLVPLIGFIISVYVVMSALVSVIPAYGNDEVAIDYYAAYLSLHGINPYVNANMANVFIFTHFPKNMITPLLTGGAVEYFVYPALSAILFMPSVMLGFPPYVTLLAFNLIFVIVLYLYYRREQFTDYLPLLVIAILLDAEYTMFSAGGITDMVWVTFIALSYIFRKNWMAAGAFFGLALAFKQIPVIILPFFMYFLFRQEGYDLKKEISFLFFLAFAFLIPNIPYIIMGPHEWFTNVTLIAKQPIIGVGIGPSVLSFAGFLYIPSAVFSIAVIAALVLFLYFYIIKFDRLRYAFFAFPVVIFLLNYRALENYIIYWPMFFLLVLPDILKKDSTVPTVPAVVASAKAQGKKALSSILTRIRASRKVVNLMIVFFIIAAAAASAGYEFVRTPTVHSPFSIMNVTGSGDPYQIPGKITSLTVEMNYTPVEGGPAQFTVYYRIFTDSKINNVNSLLWSSGNSLSRGFSNVTIYPDTSSDLLGYNTSFVLEAYYGNYTSFLNVKGISEFTTVNFANPGLNYPTYSGSKPYPGWKLKSSGSSMSTNYSYLPSGIYMNMKMPQNNNSWGHMEMTSSYNITYLAEHGYSLDYNIWNSDTNISSSFSNGSMRQFVGVRLTFDSGTEEIWIGYNSTAGYQWNFIDRNEQVIIQNSTDINFSMVYSMGQAYNWNFHDATFSFYIGTSGSGGTFHAGFSISSLSNGTARLSTGSNHGVNQEFNYGIYDASLDFTNFEARPVV